MASVRRVSVRVCLAVLAVLLATVALPVTTPTAHAAPSLPTVEPGVLTVGTEGTYTPFSYHDKTGKLTGFDVDIITDIATKLGLRVKFVEVPFDGIFSLLDSRRIDIVANQVSRTPERAAKYDLSDTYVSSAGVVVARTDDSSITSVGDLRGKTAAQSLTSNFAEIARDAGANVVSVEGFTQAITLLDQGRVQATVNDELTVKSYLTSTGNKRLHVAATTDDKSDQVFAMRKDSGLLSAVNVAVTQLKDDGTLQRTYQRYFDATERAPSSWDVIRDNLPSMLGATLSGTIPLTAISFVIGLAIALVVALARMSPQRLVSSIARLYISIIRGTPLLVQLFIIFYALPKLGIVVNPFPAAVVAFSLNVGGYAAEIIRAAIGSIDRGQWEASESLGLSRAATLRSVILPQAARTAVPPLSNTLISLVKDTSLASGILVIELFRKTQEAAAPTFAFLPLYVTAAVIYWVICLLLSFGQDRAETRLSRFVAR
ncbi:MAG: ABC transporter substrate-binding protein/permease [Gordonia paraffinivorans]